MWNSTTVTANVCANKSSLDHKIVFSKKSTTSWQQQCFVGSASRSFPVYPVVSTATIIFIIQAATEWSTIRLANIMPILCLCTNMYIIVYTYIYTYTYVRIYVLYCAYIHMYYYIISISWYILYIIMINYIYHVIYYIYNYVTPKEKIHDTQLITILDKGRAPRAPLHHLRPPNPLPRRPAILLGDLGDCTVWNSENWLKIINKWF